FAACLLALTGIFEIGKAHLAHGRLGSGGQAYFSTFEDLFGDSLDLLCAALPPQDILKPKPQLIEPMLISYDVPSAFSMQKRCFSTDPAPATVFRFEICRCQPLNLH
ncbi:hypothetical protein, partial [Pseudomonas tremae]|uniref:hypothetical protein n=1 Tax=Pseudomonas tremae TaxID=200454 RepID=UPI001F2D32D6